MKKLLLLGVALVLVLAVGGCGETVIDSAKTEGAIEHDLEKSVGLKVASVDCPSNVEVKTGTKFQCVVTEVGGKKQTATLKILNEEADVSLVDLSPNK
jgi:Na+-translocating ferredoxin:NAD+ oxidoreductase RnfC subunit